MKILLFGVAKDIVGNQVLEEPSFKAKNVAELKQELITKYPEFESGSVSENIFSKAKKYFFSQRFVYKDPGRP